MHISPCAYPPLEYSDHMQPITARTTNQSNMKSTLKVNDKVRLGFSLPNRATVTFFASCHRITQDGKAAVTIPEKITRMEWSPYKSRKILIINSVAEDCILRA